MADKDFRVKNKLHVNGLNNASGVILATNNALDSHTNLPTQYGGTGTTTSPNSGQILYSAGGTTYNPTTLNTLDVKGATYSADAPSSPVVGQIWVESDTSSDSFDPNIIRRKTFTATAAQTVFTTDLEFIQGYEQVFFNGMLLIRNSDYTTASNTNVTLAAGAAAGDIIEVVSITNLNSINAATTGANTFTGNQSASSGYGFTSNGVGGSYAQIFGNNADGAFFRLNRGGQSNQNVFISQYQGSLYLKNLDSGSTIFTNTTSDTERMRIDASGNVGIGLNSPGSRLDVYSPSSADSTIVSRFISEAPVSDGKTAIQLLKGAGGGGYGGEIAGYLTQNVGSGLRFSTVNGGTVSEVMRINSSGNVGIGYAAPNAKLEIRSANAVNDSYGLLTVGSNNFGQDFGGSISFSGVTSSDNNQSNFIPLANVFGRKENATSGDYAGYLGFGTRIHTGALTERARINSTGYMLIGYTSSNGAYRLQVNSQIFATSSSIATSDGRYKENVDTITSGLNIVDSLRPVSFTWKDHPVHNFVAGKTVGFIAQEVQEALSEYDWVDNIIKTNTSDAILDEEGNEVTPAEEFLGIAESNIIPLLVAAVKELKARVETLEANNV